MNTSQNTIINADVSWQTAFDQFRKHAQANNFSFCAWRNPGNNPNVMVGFHGRKTIKEIDLEALPSGFLAHPYHAETEAIFINQDLHIVLNNQIELVKGSEELFSEIVNDSS